ncbi:MAG: hypothetical protein Q4Q62_01855 [Thermoplasmata archaeon]|nr:hypothetical protein [Thermoplasmata archaeon]
MSDECKTIDPTAFGLFFVALVSLPLALAGFLNFMEYDNEIMGHVSKLLMLGGIMILLASYFSYKANSNFGFIVFGLVALGVFYAGYDGGDLFISITLGLIYLVCLIWSYRAKTLKTLTFILLTTALVFFANGCVVETGEAWSWLFLGIAAILNFALNLYLAFALADEHIRCY